LTTAVHGARGASGGVFGTVWGRRGTPERPAIGLRTSIASLAVVGLIGCTADVYLPPARFFPLESAATLPPGDTGIQIEGALHGAITGVSAESGTMRVRHGISDGTDGSFEVSVLHIAGGGPGDSYPYAFASRAGIKHRVTPWLSVTAGLGGGASAGGGFISPDLGAILAYENPYIVPFLAVRGSFSQPFDAQPVVVQTGPGVSPPFTWIAGGIGGIRIPIGWCAPRTCEVASSLLGGLGYTEFWYAGPNSPQGVFSVGGAAEVAF
jgi:hypothetical protein